MSSDVRPDRLLFTKNYQAPLERMVLITVYKDSGKEGLFDMAYGETIAKPVYESISTLGGSSKVIVTDNGLQGVMWFDSKEDPDYEKNHIITNVTPIVFSNIEFVNEYMLLFELSNGYKCFHSHDNDEGEYEFYLPTAIKEKYGL
ncbi:hypothetical protein Q4Q39_07220 [Flavivirga amylovorans]|uniref:Uncharacterized protein n=1 Tax=Flavivirga amylovorans TaxID=870486 RepID=A0ABT8WZT2_9FLAO|nr:hypothetical protein [Flavivirga amylovorans]MDO5987182.1 hypothetical protein [Flavivirga amylovorans]